MIRLLEVPKKKISVILVLRQTFGYTLAEANRIATSWPQDLPHIEGHRKEEQVRKALVDAGCVLEETCNLCFGDDTLRCAGCYDRYTHCAHESSADYDGPICGSMHFFTSCGRHWFEHKKKEPPRVHSGLSDGEREAITTKVDCPKCRESLAHWGYLKEDS